MMHASGWWTCAALVFSLNSAFAAGFDGLDRLYFRPVLPTGIPREIRAHLPNLLHGPLTGGKQVEHKGTGSIQVINDFPVPRQRSGPACFIRQVVDSSDESRIDDLWWALYRDGRRVDIWHYRADWNRTDMKMLSNYRLEDICPLGAGEVALHVRGSMERPGGAWWKVGLLLRCSLSPNGPVLGRVVETFWIFHGYDRGDTVDVITARDTAGRVEERLVNNVPLRRLRGCGWRRVLIAQDEMGCPDGSTPWAVVEAASRCVTAGPGARRQLRRPDEPSFCERGGKPIDWHAPSAHRQDERR